MFIIRDDDISAWTKADEIKGLYGDKVSTMEAVHKYMLESALEEEKEVYNEEGRGM